MVLNFYSEVRFYLQSRFLVVLCSRKLLYKESQDVWISVNVFASDRTVPGIIFSLFVKSFIGPVYYKHIRLCLHS